MADAPSPGPDGRDELVRAPAQPGPGQGKRWPIGKIIVISSCLLGVIGMGVAVAAFLGIRYAFKSSGAYTVAVDRLKQSAAATRELGEIQEIGFPMGRFSFEWGGTRKASLSIPVKGTLATGKYYATLARRDGVWRMVSGRVVLGDGRSIDISGQSPPR